MPTLSPVRNYSAASQGESPSAAAPGPRRSAAPGLEVPPGLAVRPASAAAQGQLSPRAELPAEKVQATLADLPNDVLNLIAPRLPVPDSVHLAQVNKRLLSLVQPSLTRLGPLVLRAGSVAGMPAGARRLRTLLDTVFASAQQQLPASEQLVLLKATVARMSLLEAPHRFVFYGVVSGQAQGLPAEEKASLITALAAQIHTLPPALRSWQPLLPELRQPFIEMVGAPSPGQSTHTLFDEGLPPEVKTGRALALAAHFERTRQIGQESVAVQFKVFKKTCAQIVDLPTSLQFAPLAALTAQVNCLLFMHGVPRPPEGQAPPEGQGQGQAWLSYRAIGVSKILAAATELAPEERFQLLTGLVDQIAKVPPQQPQRHSAMCEQVRRNIETHPLPPVHQSSLHQLLAEAEG